MKVTEVPVGPEIISESQEKVTVPSVFVMSAVTPIVPPLHTGEVPKPVTSIFGDVPKADSNKKLPNKRASPTHSSLPAPLPELICDAVYKTYPASGYF